jgi:hypothetical protein
MQQQALTELGRTWEAMYEAELVKPVGERRDTVLKETSAKALHYYAQVC